MKIYHPICMDALLPQKDDESVVRVVRMLEGAETLLAHPIYFVPRQQGSSKANVLFASPIVGKLPHTSYTLCICRDPQSGASTPLWLFRGKHPRNNNMRHNYQSPLYMQTCRIYISAPCLTSILFPLMPARDLRMVSNTNSWREPQCH